VRKKEDEGGRERGGWEGKEGKTEGRGGKGTKGKREEGNERMLKDPVPQYL
jgi:hypothetical protein